MLAQKLAAVVDMRAYAAGTAPSTDWHAGRAEPAFADPAVRVAAFALRGTGRVDALPADEFVLVLTGRLDIASDHGSLAMGPDDCGVIPFGTSFAWTASDDLLALVYSANTSAAGSSIGPVAIDKSAPLNPSNPPALENLLSEVPTCRSFSDYKSASTEFSCGTWDSTPYTRRRIPYLQVELMLLLDGAVTFTDDRDSVTFSAGDICMFVRGDGCAWRSDVYVKKVFAFHRAAG